MAADDLQTTDNSNYNTITEQQAPYIEEHSRRLLDSVGGTEDITNADGSITPGIPGLINQPYQNYEELGEAGIVDPRVAPLAAEHVQGIDLAQEGIGTYQPFLDKSAAALDGIQPAYDEQSAEAQRLMGASAEELSLQQFQNPYQQDVIDATMSEMRREEDMRLNSNSADAAAAGAFGGSRHGLVESETMRGFNETRGNELARLNQAGYDESRRAMEAYQARQFQAGQGIGALAETGANVGYNTAQGYGQVANATQQGNAQDVGTLMDIGDKTQGQLQTEYDTSYAQWQDEQDDPYQKAGFMGDIIKGTPSAANSMIGGQSPTESPIAQGIGALGSYSTIGQQFGWWD